MSIADWIESPSLTVISLANISSLLAASITLSSTTPSKSFSIKIASFSIDLSSYNTVALSAAETTLNPMKKKINKKEMNN